MIRRTYGVIFLIKRTKPLKDGTCPIFCRITIDGERKEFSTYKSILQKNWNNSLGKTRGVTIEERKVNTYIDLVKDRIEECYQNLFKQGLPISVDTLIHNYYDYEREKQLINVEYKDTITRIMSGKKITQTVGYNSWTKEEDEILITEIKNYPTNLNFAIEQAEIKLKEYNKDSNRIGIYRTLGAINSRWYVKLRKNSNTHAITCGSEKGFTQNVKNKHRNEDGTLSDQGLKHYLYIVKELLNLPNNERQLVVNLFTGNTMVNQNN